MNVHDQLPPHSHDPNPTPPGDDTGFKLRWGDDELHLTPEELYILPFFSITNCTIVSTAHPVSGPFTFRGVPLLALIDRYVNFAWEIVVSADGFCTRLTAAELRAETERPSLLALEIDGRPLSRAAGLVRLVVPGETDDALRQVKWVSEIRVM